jgi:hypothetical protein
MWRLLSATQSSNIALQILDEESIRSVVVDELLLDQVFETLTCRNSIHVVSRIEGTCRSENQRLTFIYIDVS